MMPKVVVDIQRFRFTVELDGDETYATEAHVTQVAGGPAANVLVKRSVHSDDPDPTPLERAALGGERHTIHVRAYDREGRPVREWIVRNAHGSSYTYGEFNNMELGPLLEQAMFYSATKPEIVRHKNGDT